MASFLFCIDTLGCEEGNATIKVDFFDGRLYLIPAVLATASSLVAPESFTGTLTVSSFTETAVLQALEGVIARGSIEEVMGHHTFSLRFFGPYDELDSPDWAVAFENELKRELSPSHGLYPYRDELQAWAKRADNDDVYFRGPQHALVLVHLTWSQKEESPPWPGHAVYPSLKAFWEEEMRYEIKD